MMNQFRQPALIAVVAVSALVAARTVAQNVGDCDPLTPESNASCTGAMSCYSSPINQCMGFPFDCGDDCCDATSPCTAAVPTANKMFGDCINT